MLCYSVLRRLSLDHVREDPGSLVLSLQTRAQVVTIKHSLSMNSSPYELCLEFLLLDDVSTGIVMSIVKRGSAIGTAIMRRVVPQMFYIQKINPSIITLWLKNCEEEHGERC